MAVPPPSSAFDEDKATLRTRLRAARSGMTGDGGALHARLKPLLARAGPFAGYVAHRGEPDILPFLLDALHLGHRIALPRLAGGTMRFVDWHPDHALGVGPLGIPQPVSEIEIEPALLLVPLVAFDRRGMRLGQGGGYYDRWFAAHRHATRIGIAWAMQEVDALPVDPWDMPLDVIVTEQEWIEP